MIHLGFDSLKKAARVTKDDWPVGFLEGVRLFNEGHFFETHEVWEEVWKAAAAEERDFYQGMVHLTVALYQAGRANWRAAHSQLRRAAKRLARFEPLHGNLDVRRLRMAIAEAVAQLEAAPAGTAPYFPRISLTPTACPESPPGP